VAGDPAVLGEEVARFCGELPLPRAISLLDGAPPQNAAEQDFLQRAQAGGA
jgi:hypothetical protein